MNESHESHDPSDDGLSAGDLELIEDADTTTVFLVRHGRTALNAEGRLRGHLDPPLDAVGRDEAKALAVALCTFEPALVVTSPLRRALDTAAAIAAECGLVAEVDSRLIDRDYGSHAGARREEVVARWGSVNNAPGVELLNDVVVRAVVALEDAVRRARPEPVVIVAHDAINRPLLALFAPARFSGPEAVPQRTGCLNIVYRSPIRWVVAKVDLLPTADGTVGRWR